MSGRVGKPAIGYIGETLERLYENVKRHPYVMCPKCKKRVVNKPHELTVCYLDEALKEFYILKGWLSALNNAVEKLRQPTPKV